MSRERSELKHNLDSNLPKITFSLPTYNGAEFLDSCLRSIYSQDYPRDKIEVMIADGGSTDGTLEIVTKYGLKAFPNPKKLADWGAKINVSNATGDLLVIWAADNEIVNKNWLKTVAKIFKLNPELACFWCNMVASPNDPDINRYYELIKSDPLMFSINKNLLWYLSNNSLKSIDGIDYTTFETISERPLVWGANGLVYRLNYVKDIILQDGFVGDNDVFQIMIENGNNKLAYSNDLKICHHYLKNFSHWISKWKRNYQQHLIPHIRSRNMNWLYVKNFKLKIGLWSVYSLIPIFSTIHTLYLILRDKNIYWKYHPLASFFQAWFLVKMTLGSSKGRKFLTDLE